MVRGVGSSLSWPEWPYSFLVTERMVGEHTEEEEEGAGKDVQSSLSGEGGGEWMIVSPSSINLPGLFP